MYKNLKILIIDVGHGGSDPGAVANGIVEKTANLNTALALKAKAEAAGIKVFIIRSTDITMSLQARVDFANNIARQYPGAEIVFVSVHHNAGGGDRGEYIHSVYRGNGQKLAEMIGVEMNTVVGQQKKVYEKRGSDNKDYYFVIRNTSMDAVIVEVCFLDNVTDVQIADTVEEQKRNGVVIANAIIKYFGIAVTAPEQPVAPPTQNTTDKEIRRYKENGKCTVTTSAGIYFRDKPSTVDGVKQGTYSHMQSVFYDLVVISEKYVWISWVSASKGVRRYMPVKNRATGERYATCV